MMTSDPSDPPPTASEQVQILFVRHQGAIRAFVRGLQPSLADADDILQETFLTISRKAETFENGSNFVSWACSIARLKVLEHYRQHKRATVLSEAAVHALADDFPTEKWIEQRETALMKCLEKIAPKTRNLIWRRYNQQQTSEEMASDCGMSAMAVRVALTKARAYLRDCVASELQKIS